MRRCVRDDSDPAEGPGSQRRAAPRVDVTWSVDCRTADTFLYASISNLSELGIFVRTTEPLPVGTQLTLCFEPPGEAGFTLRGVVQWTNPVRPFSDNRNPGMGIRFVGLDADSRRRLSELVRTLAFVHDAPS